MPTTYADFSKSSSITDYVVFTTQLKKLCCFASLPIKIKSKLTAVVMVFCKTALTMVTRLTMVTFESTWKIVSSTAMLTFKTVKNSFIIDCADYADFQSYMKNNFVTT